MYMLYVLLQYQCRNITKVLSKTLSDLNAVCFNSSTALLDIFVYWRTTSALLLLLLLLLLT